MSTYPDLAAAPRFKQQTFLAYCIGVVAFPPLAAIMFFLVFRDICTGVNFLATRQLRHPQPSPTAGTSLRFY